MKKKSKVNRDSFKDKLSYITSPHTYPNCALAVGALLLMGAIPEKGYSLTEAQALMALTDTQTEQKSERMSHDLHVLKQQLRDKTKELEEYKAQLFRASHPQDQAKIIDLRRRIAEHEKAKLRMENSIETLERELSDAQKQIRSLETSATAFSSLLQEQLHAIEAEKEELAAKLHALEQDTTLEEEKRRNTTLQQRVSSLEDTVAENEQRFKALIDQHDQELQDALQEAAMLKFELADLRSKQKENNALQENLALQTKPSENDAEQYSLNKELDEARAEIELLKSIVDDMTAENVQLHSENEVLQEKITDDLLSFSEPDLGRDNWEKWLFEKEEYPSPIADGYDYGLGNEVSEQLALLETREREFHNAKEEYEHTLALQSNQLGELENKLTSLKEQAQADLEEKELARLQLEVEKQGLENRLQDLEEEFGRLQLGYDSSINDYMSKLEDLKAKLDHEQAERLSLLDTLQLTLLENEVEKDKLLSKVREIENLAESAAEENQSATRYFVEEINTLKTHAEIEASFAKNMQELNRHLAEVLEAEKEAHQAALTEKDYALEEAKFALQSAISEYLDEKQQLQQSLAEEKIKTDHIKQDYDALVQQIEDDRSSIVSLLDKIKEMNVQAVSRNDKAKELENALYSLTVVAQQQDQALAEANITFSLVQEYSQRLEMENAELKNRVSELETPRRKAGALDAENKASLLNQQIKVLSPDLLKVICAPINDK